ncbi:DExH-box splicing factor binding site-domain-containing protein [Chaetomium sp. MPI-SDFR-AT-0129]|nr:DExH-box splicing factor binding site-domain-containing protein [Chaetomium sp. MPI-SDFR-AT-0129]
MSNDGDKSSRIAIQLGNHAPAGSPHGFKKHTRPTHGKRHRAHSLHEESGSEDNSDGEHQSYGRKETITSWELPGANLDTEKPSRRDNSSKHKTTTKGEEHDDSDQPDRRGASQGPREPGSEPSDSGPQNKPTKWGLTINMRGAKDGAKEGSNPRTVAAGSKSGTKREDDPSKSIDDEALDALMGARNPKRKHPDSDAADREPRAEDYQSIPIDDFGAHLLRGFGWDGKMKGKVKDVTRHANLTGLGAKDVKGAEDLGAWNQKTVKDSRPVRLDDYRREESKKRQRVEDRYADSYKRERERERDRERDRRRER